MRKLTIELAAMTVCAALAAATAGAQSRTTVSERYRDRAAAAEEPSRLYPFMDSVGFPQEWHAHKRPADTEGDAPPRPASAAHTSRTSESRATIKPVRSYSDEERDTAHIRPVRRTSSAPKPWSSRPVPAENSISESQWRPAQTLAANRTHTAQRRSTAQNAPFENHAARSEWRPANYRPAGSPYAFMDTVGFPQPYRPAAARGTGVVTSRRATTSVARRTGRSHTALEPGYSEVR